MPQMTHGKIAKLVTEKGFGFIKSDNGEDFFFHRSGLQTTTRPFDELVVGNRVRFSELDAPKGLRAVEVEVLAES